MKTNKYNVGGVGASFLTPTESDKRLMASDYISNILSTYIIPVNPTDSMRVLTVTWKAQFSTYVIKLGLRVNRETSLARSLCMEQLGISALNRRTHLKSDVGKETNSLTAMGSLCP